MLERGLGVLEVGLGLGTGGLVTKGIERSADRLLIRELQSQTGKLTGREVARFSEGQLFLEAPELGGVIALDIPKGGGRGSIFETTTFSSFGEEAKLTTKLRSKVFEIGADKFSTTGTGKSTLEFFSFEKGKPIKIIEELKFGAKPKVSQLPPKLSSFVSIEGAKPLKGIETLEDFTGSFGKGFIKRGKDEFKQFRFGGISKDIESELGKFTQMQGGRVSGLNLKGVEDLFRGGKTFRGGSVKIPISERGAIKRLTFSETDLGTGFGSSAKTKKTSLAQTFEQILAPPPIGISKSIEKQIFQAPIIKTADVSKSLIGIPRAVGGEGLTQQQISKGQGLVSPGLVQQDFSQPLIFPPAGKQSFGSGLVSSQFQQIRSKDTFGIGALDKIIQRDITITKERTLQIPETKLDVKLSEKQIQKQFQITEQSLAPPPSIPRGRTPFDPFVRGGFELPFIPPFLLIPKERGSPRRIRKGRKVKSRIAASFTGIVLEIETGIPETTILGGVDLGILPGQIRGIAKRKKTKKKTSKKKSKKKKKK